MTSTTSRREISPLRPRVHSFMKETLASSQKREAISPKPRRINTGVSDREKSHNPRHSVGSLATGPAVIVRSIIAHQADGAVPSNQPKLVRKVLTSKSPRHQELTIKSYRSRTPTTPKMGLNSSLESSGTMSSKPEGGVIKRSVSSNCGVAAKPSVFRFVRVLNTSSPSPPIPSSSESPRNSASLPHETTIKRTVTVTQKSTPERRDPVSSSSPPPAVLFGHEGEVEEPLVVLVCYKVEEYDGPIQTLLKTNPMWIGHEQTFKMDASLQCETYGTMTIHYLVSQSDPNTRYLLRVPHIGTASTVSSSTVISEKSVARNRCTEECLQRFHVQSYARAYNSQNPPCCVDVVPLYLVRIPCDSTLLQTTPKASSRSANCPPRSPISEACWGTIERVVEVTTGVSEYASTRWAAAIAEWHAQCVALTLLPGTPTTFAHYVYEVSSGECLVADLVGFCTTNTGLIKPNSTHVSHNHSSDESDAVGRRMYVFTSYEIYYASENAPNMQRFLQESHSCTPICQALGLPRRRKDSLEKAPTVCITTPLNDSLKPLIGAGFGPKKDSFLFDAHGSTSRNLVQVERASIRNTFQEPHTREEHAANLPLRSPSIMPSPFRTTTTQPSSESNPSPARNSVSSTTRDAEGKLTIWDGIRDALVAAEQHGPLGWESILIYRLMTRITQSYGDAEDYPSGQRSLVLSFTWTSTRYETFLSTDADQDSSAGSSGAALSRVPVTPSLVLTCERAIGSGIVQGSHIPWIEPNVEAGSHRGSSPQAVVRSMEDREAWWSGSCLVPFLLINPKFLAASKSSCNERSKQQVFAENKSVVLVDLDDSGEGTHIARSLNLRAFRGKASVGVEGGAGSTPKVGLDIPDTRHFAREHCMLLSHGFSRDFLTMSFVEADSARAADLYRTAFLQRDHFDGLPPSANGGKATMKNERESTELKYVFVFYLIDRITGRVRHLLETPAIAHFHSSQSSPLISSTCSLVRSAMPTPRDNLLWIFLVNRGPLNSSVKRGGTGGSDDEEEATAGRIVLYDIVGGREVSCIDLPDVRPQLFCSFTDIAFVGSPRVSHLFRITAAGNSSHRQWEEWNLTPVTAALDAAVSHLKRASSCSGTYAGSISEDVPHHVIVDMQACERSELSLLAVLFLTATDPNRLSAHLYDACSGLQLYVLKVATDPRKGILPKGNGSCGIRIAAHRIPAEHAARRAGGKMEVSVSSLFDRHRGVDHEPMIAVSTIGCTVGIWWCDAHCILHKVQLDAPDDSTHRMSSIHRSGGGAQADAGQVLAVDFQSITSKSASNHPLPGAASESHPSPRRIIRDMILRTDAHANALILVDCCAQHPDAESCSLESDCTEVYGLHGS